MKTSHAIVWLMIVCGAWCPLALATQKYVEGEVLVTFKDGAHPENILKDDQVQPLSVQRIHTITPIVNKYKKTLILEKTSGGWYSFYGKNYKDASLIPDEELFKGAYEKMSAERRALYRKYKLRLGPDVSVPVAVKQLSKNPDIEDARPNYYREAYGAPNDPRYADQWGLPKINAALSWDLAQGGSTVTVAIIDTGVDYLHKDLARNIWVNPGEIANNGQDDDGNGYIDDVRGYDFVSVSSSEVYPGEDPGPPDNDPMDFLGHGSHCTGIAGAVINNGIGIAGVAVNATIMPVRAGYQRSDGDGVLEDADIEQAIVYAVDNGARVISMSFGGSEPGAFANEIAMAYQENVVLVAAAGNSGISNRSYPAAYDGVISVAATNSSDGLASFSNYGSWVDVAAPGMGILSTVPGDSYESWSGTSMAGPHVAGLAAMILSLHPGYTSDQIADIIITSVRVLPALEGKFKVGFGIIDAYSALSQSMTIRAYISDVVIDYGKGLAFISGTAEGAAFASYELAYCGDGSSDWLPITPGPVTTSVHQALLARWDLTDSGIRKGAIRLTVRGTDGSILETAQGLTPELFIVPEHLVSVKAGNIDPYLKFGNTLGIYRLGSSVPFVGYADGKYRLEWSGPGSGVWHTDGFDLDVRRGHVGIWNTQEVTDEGLYTIRIIDENDKEFITQVRLSRDLLAGFPLSLPPSSDNEQPVSSMARSRFGNVDDDPASEIVVVSTGQPRPRISVYGLDGAVKKSWLLSTGDIIVSGSEYPALADLDNDGRDEIVIITYTDNGSNRYIPKLSCFRGDGTLFFARDFPAGDSRVSCMRDAVMITDLNADKKPEIIYRHPAGMYVMNEQGHDLSAAWPKPIASGFLASGGLFAVLADTNFMTTGNFDDDNDREIVIAENYVTGSSSFGFRLHVLNIDGTEVAGWPKTVTGRLCSGPVVAGKVSGTGYDDIVLMAKNSVTYNRSNYLYGIDRSGKTFLTITDIDTDQGEPDLANIILADVNNDGRQEILCDDWDLGGGRTGIRLFTGNGSTVGQWPYGVDWLLTDTVKPFAAGDIDGDGGIEIMALAKEETFQDDNINASLVIIGTNGDRKATHPLDGRVVLEEPVLPFQNWHRPNTVSFIDLDADGLGEVVVAGMAPVMDYEKESYLWARPTIEVYKTDTVIDPDSLAWPVRYHDCRNTSWTGFFPLTNLAPPAGLTAVLSGPREVSLTWQDRSSDEGGFYIERATASGDFTLCGSVGGNIVTFTDGSVEDNTAYRYRIQAYDNAVTSPYSNVAYVTTDPGAPLAPGDLYATADAAARVTLYWQDYASNEDGFNIYRSFAQYGVYVLIDTVASDVTSYDDAGVNGNTGYFYKICAYNGHGMSPFSNIAERMTLIGLPRAPSDVKALVRSTTAIALCWVDNEQDVLEFNIYRRTGDDGDYGLVAVVPAQDFSYNDTSLDPDTTYWYKVAAVNAKGTSPYSNETSAVTSTKPVFFPLGLQRVREGATLTFMVDASDPMGKALVYNASDLPRGASFDAETRTFTWTPAEGQEGIYDPISFSATNGLESSFLSVAVVVLGKPFIVPAALDGDGVNELVVDFGPQYGVWILKGVSWEKLHPLSVKTIVKGDFDGDKNDELIMDFQQYGLWIYKSGSGDWASRWTKLNDLSASLIKVADLDGDGKAEIIVDFGGEYGAWVYHENGTWTRFLWVSPQEVLIGDTDGDHREEVIANFSENGLWLYNDETWTHVLPIVPILMKLADLDNDGREELLGVFDNGMWIYGNGAWSHLLPVNPVKMIIGDLSGDHRDRLIGALDNGIWSYVNGSWNYLVPVPPVSMMAGDLNGDGKDEIVGTFDNGLWIYGNGLWAYLLPVNPWFMVIDDLNGNGKDDIIGDFGNGGIWVYYDDSTWEHIALVTSG
ncbi:MAG: S8 family serine peptidase [Candidatus Omnitrophica bacterium]|nr:S8 family serine peptidase [Candidatus Omnitrophota bacterium]